MLKSQDILYPPLSSAKPNPINTLWVTDALAETQSFGMLNNGAISHHINRLRRFMNHMLFSIFRQSEYCRRITCLTSKVDSKVPTVCLFQWGVFPVFEWCIYLSHMALFCSECTSFSLFLGRRSVRVQGPVRCLGYGPVEGAHGTATAILSWTHMFCSSSYRNSTGSTHQVRNLKCADLSKQHVTETEVVRNWSTDMTSWQDLS